jgi:splicing factor 45
MVGPGEIDNELQSEIEEECKKFGNVEKCVVYEDKYPGVPIDQVIRIFVKFTAVDSTKKGKSEFKFIVMLT